MRNDMGFGLFRLFFSLVLILVLGMFTVTAFLGYKCYTSGNPNDMACFMLSERLEVGVRNR